MRCVQRASDRFCADYGWLQTCYSFSFADYRDPGNLAWGALRVHNDDRIAPHTGFPMHPHRDMEIITYVLAGELTHEDSAGHRGIVKSGGMQYLSAGTGVRHSEYNRGEEELHLLQMWILPPSAGLAVRYGQRDFSVEDRRGRWLVAAAGNPDAAPIALYQNARLVVARLDGERLVHRFDAGRFGFLFIAEGEADVDGERLQTGDALRMADEDGFAVRGKAEIVLWDLPPRPDGRPA